jgi:hypothetical protein
MPTRFARQQFADLAQYRFETTLGRITRGIITRSRLRTPSVFWSDMLLAGTCAAVLSGIPSTLHAWWSGGDMLEATRAAGAMLIPAQSSGRALFAAATLVHGTVSFFWAAILTWVLPRERVLMGSVLAAAAIALLDLRVIARAFFPEVYALDFWPQFADHVAWGAAVGATLHWRFRRRVRQPSVRPSSR